MKSKFFLNYDVGEPMGRMLKLDRFKINQIGICQFSRNFNYHHNLIIYPNMACEMLIESSWCSIKKLKKNSKKE